ncbi:MAG: hypothetical protein JO345_11170 [Streptosporangiaceae bacterium]|nr:hypothetical protein [Streptosporangiaceae bacterium]
MTTELEPGSARAAAGGPGKSSAAGLVPRPRGAHAAARPALLRRQAVASAGRTADPVAMASTLPITPSRDAVSATRATAADLAAALVVATVVPLTLLQIPDAIAWAIPPRFASPGSATGLLRASGLALCAMVVAAPSGGLAVRRFRAWPVLIAGLGVFGAADILGSGARTIGQVGIDRSLHGAGAGVALAAVSALVAERPEHARRGLTGWWALCLMAGLAAAPELMRQRLSDGDWHAALQPYPWLTGIALGAAAVYALAAAGALTEGTRNNFPPAERARIALLMAPVAGMCATTIAVTYGRTDAVIAAAIAESIALAGLGVMTGLSGSAAWLAVVGAVTGFAVAPAAGAVTDLVNLSPHSWLMLAAFVGGATAGGVVLAAILPARWAGIAISCGLALAAMGFAAGYLVSLTGLTGRHGQLIAVAWAPVACGLAGALATALRRTGAAGAMCGTVLLLAGVMTGYLADGAIELQAVSAGARRAAAVRGALLTADSRWNIAAAAVTAAVALGVFACSMTRSGLASHGTETER